MLKYDAHLACKVELEDEVEDSLGDLGAHGLLQVQLVALDHVVRVLGTPPDHHPAQNNSIPSVQLKSHIKVSHNNLSMIYYA